MLLVQFKREQEQHRLHIQRIRDTKAMLDSSTPESLGLKHLAVRPKKQQLIEDRRQKVAKENAKLMEGMTKIMNERRGQSNHSMPVSLNEVQRKREVDRVNFENNLMLDRLNRIAPTFSKAQLEDDFKKHLKAEANLRKRQMKPLSLPKDMTGTKVKDKSSLFDASTYASQHESFGGGSRGGTSVLETEFDSPIKSMKEFRQHVIATKKMGAGGDVRSTVRSTASHSPEQVDIATLNKRSLRDVSEHRNESLFELEHQPV
mmetsp:Transcript_18737/g.41708  ORF Transcript_18737/g.41708 Transcript_18737/m.41708 type:complete len:260 (-) Transcript_18737:2746-3525(-)|eukprot:CAMPEP_0173237190 /NCGR_PEP_ID=MMETSP1142-20121109/11901_1 /TAXON_ID=483371 /ORGANISM="non described non described, Strain CCMP2298" /LENGTH=259 /DNA_ID=CAMNT_0014167829 /DNA_START=117 /DNA_END=896 /DNA_ORIENTATION=-